MSVDWQKLKALLMKPSSATDPSRDHELAAMVPDLLWEMGSTPAMDAFNACAKPQPPAPLQLSPEAEALLKRLKALGSSQIPRPIYLDELPAANELVKAGMASFPALELRYAPGTGNLKYLHVALWLDEGTLEPLSDDELRAVRNLLECGCICAATPKRLVDAGIIDYWPGDVLRFTAAALKNHHRRQPSQAEPEIKPQKRERREYRMVVRKAGPMVPFREILNGGYFIHNAMLHVKQWDDRSRTAILDCGGDSDGYVGAGQSVQPVEVTWEEV